MIWYVMRGERELGPLGEDALRALVGTGQVTADTRLWHAGLACWTAAAALPGVLGPGTTVTRASPPAKRGADRTQAAAGICLLALAALLALGLYVQGKPAFGLSDGPQARATAAATAR